MLGLLAIVGCGGGGDGGGGCDPIAATLVSRIVVAPALPTLADGASVQLVATAFSCDDTPLSVPSFTWSSEDATTVSVSASGMAQALKVGGPVAVTAAVQGKQGSAHVLVAARAVASVRVEPATANVAVGRTSTLVAKAFDAQGNELSGRTATWSSGNEALVTVSQAGGITGVVAGGPVTVTATIEGQSGTAQVTVVEAAVASVTVSPSTSNIEAGSTVQLSAVLKDDQGNVLAGRAILWSTTDPVRASVSTTGLVTGLAPGGPVTILATSEGRSGGAQVTVTPAPATKVGFLAQPTSTVAGVSISPAVQVEIQNPLGGRVTTSSAPVTLSLGTNPGSGTLTGTLTVAAVNGVATFNNLKINRTGPGYTLAAASTGLTGATSTAFDITAGAPASLRWLAQPTSVVAGAEIAQMQVELLDALGNRATGTGSTSQVTLSLGNNPGGANLNGTASVNAVAGVATFNGLSLNVAGGGYTLVAASAALPTVTSDPFNVTPGAPAALAFIVQPGNAVAGSAIPSFQVEVRDAFGNLVTNASTAVTLSVGNNPGGATLGGTLVANTANGVATFDAVTLDVVGDGYTLVASAGAPSTTSALFDVAPGPATQLGFAVQPANITENVPFSPEVAVEVRDALGNRATGFVGSVSLQLRSETGGGAGKGNVLVGGEVRAFVQGLAVFSGMTASVNGLSRNFILRTQGSIAVVASDVFTVSAF